MLGEKRGGMKVSFRSVMAITTARWYLDIDNLTLPHQLRRWGAQARRQPGWKRVQRVRRLRHRSLLSSEIPIESV